MARTFQLAENIAERIREQWDTFGVPATYWEARENVGRYTRMEVQYGSGDVIEAFEAFGDTDRAGERFADDPVGFGAYLSEWLEGVVAKELEDDLSYYPSEDDPTVGECPKCGSDAIEGDSVTIEYGIAWQECRCEECGHEWQDVYRLVKQESDEDE